MAIQLNVKFSGLCQYVVHPDGKQVAVLMPRTTKMDDPNARHVDGTDGRKHVGYMRLDLGNIETATPFPPGNQATGPLFEVVHRFDREEIEFIFDPEDEPQPDPDCDRRADPGRIDICNAEVADARIYAPTLELRADLFDLNPTEKSPLLFRTLLMGGRLEGKSQKTWVMPPALCYAATPYTKAFAGVCTWTRRVKGTTVTLRLRTFGETVTRDIVLHPVTIGGSKVISLKFANLCADDPLEWGVFEPRVVFEDVDFKWFYRLFKSNEDGGLGGELLGAQLPCPRIPLDGFQTEGDPGCGQNLTSASFVHPTLPVKRATPKRKGRARR